MSLTSLCLCFLISNVGIIVTLTSQNKWKDGWKALNVSSGQVLWAIWVWSLRVYWMSTLGTPLWRRWYWRDGFQAMTRPYSCSTLSLLGVYNLIEDIQPRREQLPCKALSDYRITGSLLCLVTEFLTPAACETLLGCSEKRQLPGPFPQTSYTEFLNLEWMDEPVCASISSSGNLGWYLYLLQRVVVRMKRVNACQGL